ncbi:GNAT family N-acetyltransferase [Geothrix sp. PMB-07]|uniref:GNAT family N-acetyltransferase n=1 Tax=Geothrix sp. PMB-07 TaxID=3068640 RepID=UPI0027423474|nr:GNAT family N-acetyltransferase [Geothrix sp. PMB-07]WLT32484.1 GNAT family N-acetyltransferase [Geothrix sp. PMB-07]
MAAVVQPFQPGQEAQVLDLILPIQRLEFGVPITAADQPDLARIPEIYQTGRGGFWVGVELGQVVGTIGLIDFGQAPGGGGALRKMFLQKAQRGSGLAQALLDALLVHAKARQLPGIWLGTLPHMGAAHRFYERNGFRRVEPGDLPPDFPRMPVDTVFYALELTHVPAR